MEDTRSFGFQSLHYPNSFLVEQGHKKIVPVTSTSEYNVAVYKTLKVFMRDRGHSPAAPRLHRDNLYIISNCKVLR